MCLLLVGKPGAHGPPGTRIMGRWPNCSAPMISPGKILSQMPSSRAPSNTLWERPITVDMAITSRLTRLRSMPGSPWVTPSHMAGTPVATWATPPAVATAFFMITESFRRYGGPKAYHYRTL